MTTCRAKTTEEDSFKNSPKTFIHSNQKPCQITYTRMLTTIIGGYTQIDDDNERIVRCVIPEIKHINIISELIQQDGRNVIQNR